MGYPYSELFVLTLQYKVRPAFYDAENRLIQLDGTLGTCSSATECYSYDAEGRRTEKIAGSAWLDRVLDLGGNPIVIYSAPGSQAAYISFRGSFIAQYSANTTYFVQVDNVGTTRLMTNVSGGVFDSRDYLPFGEQIAGSGGQYGLKFNGKERDLESGLDNFGARYYTSNLGRFMTPDWAARPTAVPYAVFGDPQSLNLYTYVRNDPVTLADADGHAQNVAPPLDCESGAGCRGDTEKGHKAMGGQRHLLGHLRNALSQTTVKVTIGVGIGGKVKAGPGEVKAEAAAKANFAFSAGKLSVSKSVDVGATVGKWHKEFGLSASAEQVVGSVNIDTGERGGLEPATGETVVGGSNKTLGGNAGNEGVEFGGEEGEGALGGGSVSITNGGLGELRDAWREVRDAVGSAVERVLTSPISQ